MTSPATGTESDRVFLVWVGVTVAAILAVSVAVATGGIAANKGFANVTQIIAPLIATLVAAHAATRTRDRHWRLGWWLIAASTLSWCIGQCIWTWYESVQGRDVPFPSAADVGYLLSVPLAAAGLLVFPSSPTRFATRTRTLLDALIVAGSALFVSWVVVLGPTFRNGDESALERVISVAYPVADVVLLTIVVVVLTRSTGSSRLPLSFVGAGFAMFAIADSTFVYTTVHELGTSPISNATWVAGYLLIALGAYAAVLHPPDERAEDGAPGRLALLLPYLPLGAVLLVAAVSRITSDEVRIDATEFSIGALLIAILLVRQALVLLDNARLTRSLADSMARLEHQALHDPLTGLPNRALFNDRLGVALSRTERVPELLAVMFVDLDRFKPINDALGHKSGDLVLMTVADRISGSLRAQDSVARFGGDEFLVLCEDLPDAAEATTVADRINEYVSRPIHVGLDEVSVTCSIGVVLVNSSREPRDEVLRLADQAMYSVKHTGRDGVRVLDRRFPRVADGLPGALNS